MHLEEPRERTRRFRGLGQASDPHIERQKSKECSELQQDEGLAMGIAFEMLVLVGSVCGAG